MHIFFSSNVCSLYMQVIGKPISHNKPCSKWFAHSIGFQTSAITTELWFDMHFKKNRIEEMG